MSFDLFVYAPSVPSDVERRVVEALWAMKRNAHCRVEREGGDGQASIAVQIQAPGSATPAFDEQGDATYIHFGPFDSEDLGVPEGASAEQKRKLSACRFEGHVSTSAGRSDEALASQVLAAVAVMRACDGVLLDPQTSVADFPELETLMKTVPGVPEGYFFEFGHAVQWARAVLGEWAG